MTKHHLKAEIQIHPLPTGHWWILLYNQKAKKKKKGNNLAYPTACYSTFYQLSNEKIVHETVGVLLCQIKSRLQMFPWFLFYIEELPLDLTEMLSK